MTEHKYWTRRYSGQPFGHTTTVQQVPLGGVSATRTSSDTVLRTIYFPKLIAIVGAPDVAPPEQWWSRFQVHFCANANTNGGTSLANPFSGDVRILSGALLSSRMVASPSAPNEYTVVWEGPKDGIQSFAQRKGFGGSALPTVYTQFFLVDPVAGYVGNFYSGIGVEMVCDQAVLWGSPSAG